MTDLNSLVKVMSKSSKRVGRGQGSGKSKTSGRGQKGQNSRNKLSITHSHYEGGQRSLMKRLPYRRGKGNPKMSEKPVVVKTEQLVKLKISGVVDAQALIKAGLIKPEEGAKIIKILGAGFPQKNVEIKLPVSKQLAGKLNGK